MKVFNEPASKDNLKLDLSQKLQQNKEFELSESRNFSKSTGITSKLTERRAKINLNLSSRVQFSEKAGKLGNKSTKRP